MHIFRQCLDIVSPRCTLDQDIHWYVLAHWSKRAELGWYLHMAFMGILHDLGYTLELNDLLDAPAAPMSLHDFPVLAKEYGYFDYTATKEKSWRNDQWTTDYRIGPGPPPTTMPDPALRKIKVAD